jgi:hypothetical protein
MRVPFLPVLIAVGSLACRERAPTAPPVDLVKTIPMGAAQVIVEQQPASAAGSLTFVVRVLSNGVKMGAYQGAVTFVPGAFELVSVETPKDAGSDYYIVNSSAFAEGRIRFAAYTTEAFSGTEAFRVTVKPLRPVSQAMLAGALEVAGEVTGSAVPAARLKPSQGIHDAMSGLLVVQ